MLDVQLFDLHTFLPKPYEEALLPRLKKAHEELQTGTGLGGRNQEIALSAAQPGAGQMDNRLTACYEGQRLFTGLVILGDGRKEAAGIPGGTPPVSYTHLRAHET